MLPRPFPKLLSRLARHGRERFIEAYGERFLFVTSKLGVDYAPEPVASFEPLSATLPAPPGGGRAASVDESLVCYPLKLLDQKGKLRLGRNEAQVDLVIPDLSVSQMHARLFIQDDVVHVFDLSSSNGSFLDEWPVPRQRESALALGDDHQLRLGSVNLRYAAFEPLWRLFDIMQPNAAGL